MTLIDFGSAWGIEHTVRRHQGDGKSDQYAAPEIIADYKTVDFRADYFSLAAVCYELLTLQVPYDGLGGRAGSAQYRSEPDSLYVPPSSICREASRLDRSIWQAIDALLGRALQLDPQHRFASGPEWLTAWDSVNDLIRRPPQQSPLNRFRGACSVSLLLTQLQECQPGDDREMQPYATAIGSTQ
ncbi:MAG: protein kinase domain-containing protein [Planctomycetaceae bacterium]